MHKERPFPQVALTADEPPHMRQKYIVSPLHNLQYA